MEATFCYNILGSLLTFFLQGQRKVGGSYRKSLRFLPRLGFMQPLEASFCMEVF